MLLSKSFQLLNGQCSGKCGVPDRWDVSIDTLVIHHLTLGTVQPWWGTVPRRTTKRHVNHVTHMVWDDAARKPSGNTCMSTVADFLLQSRLKFPAEVSSANVHIPTTGSSPKALQNVSVPRRHIRATRR